MRNRLLRNLIGTVLVTVLVLGVPLALVSGSLVTDGVRSAVAIRAEAIAAVLAEQLVDTGDIDLGRVGIPAGWRLEVAEPGGSISMSGADVDPTMIAATVPLPDGGQLTLRSPDDALDQSRGRAYGLVAGAVLLSLLVGVGIALLTARRLVTPLSDLTGRAARLGAGDFRTFARRYGILELDRVADVLDASALQVAALLEGERDLAGDVSHQLRTRLTGIQLRLDELSGHTDPHVRAEVAHALQQTDRLVAIVNDLLANARSRRAASAAELDLDQELREVVDGWRDAFRITGRTLQVDLPPGLAVRATPVRLREALGVLLDNALAHGSGMVRVTVRAHVGQVLLEVTDEGSGIADALVPHVFDRGVSGAASSGLGLGLARAFVEADGGRLELRRPRPATFALFLASVDRSEPDQSVVGSAEPERPVTAADPPAPGDGATPAAH